MTFRQMELFILVCEYKSISKASEKLFISQQGVSKMIRELEKELSCKLLNRTKNGISPTESGLYFLGECREILERRDSILSNISNKKGIPYETIYIGMSYGMIAALPHRLIPTFEQNYDFINISYSDNTDLYLEPLLKNGDYDFCITAGIFDEDSFSSELLFSEDVYLCIPKTHELFSKDEIEMSDLKDMHFAMFTTQFHIRHNFVASCKKAGFEPIIDVSSNDFNSLKEVAIHNNLLFVVPEHTIIANKDKLKYLKFPDENFLWNIYFSKKKNKFMTNNMLSFYNFLKNSLPTSNK